MNLSALDETHDPSLVSWVESANGHAEFPIQNLPFGRCLDAGSQPRACVAVGASVIDLQALLECGLLTDDAEQAATASCRGSGNALVGLAPAQRLALRRGLSDLLRIGGPLADRARAASERFLLDADACTLGLPATIGSYTDFNAGIHHAANGGRRRGLKDPLLSNYRYVPVAYHSRATSVQPSGSPVRRPWGQFLPAGSEQPVFQPTQKLDFELEIGIWVGAGNELGQPVPIGEASRHIAGYCLVNDWSSRDIQSWESQRLGPFLGKNFCTSISPWIVTPEALAPFRGPAFERGAEHPAPLPYLADETDAREGMPQLDLEVWVAPSSGEEASLVSRTHTRHLFWTPAQMLTHHTSNGCNLQPGDLLATGTVTGTDPDSFGTFLDAPQPRFLADGEQLTLKARAKRDGFVAIGFGDCTGTIQPAMPAR